jgi:hypothetical protein
MLLCFYYTLREQSLLIPGGGAEDIHQLVLFLHGLLMFPNKF